MLFNYIKETRHNQTITRYNGGWLKTVTGLDKTVTNGFSIEGSFVQAGDFKMDYEPGLYLDCSKGGSRKNQKRNYHLFRVDGKGFHLLQTLEDAQGAWACEFWETIENLIETGADVQVTGEELAEMVYRRTKDPKVLQDLIDILECGL